MRFTIERSISFIQDILHSCNLIHAVLHSGSFIQEILQFLIMSIQFYTVLVLYRKFDSF